MRSPFFYLLLLTLAGCSDSNLPDYYELRGLQVLALKADPPEVDPTAGPATVNVTPLLTDIKGAGRTLTYTVETCLDPGVNLGAIPSCEKDPAKTSQSGTVALTAPRYTEAVAALSVSVPPTVFAGRTEADKYNGVPFLILYRLQSSDGEKELAFRRILATTRAVRNVAPSLVEIQKEGTAITSLPSEKSPLTPKIGGSAESYSLMATDGSLQERKESLTVTWFISEGEMKFARTVDETSNEWTPPASPTLPLFLVAVVRDGRGGVDSILVGP